jgi:hypothetical protein
MKMEEINADKMNVFWNLYCSMDENGRKELLKRKFARPVMDPGNFDKIENPSAFENRPTF